MNDQEFKYVIDKFQLLSKREGADEMYMKILVTLSMNLSGRQMNKLIPKMVKTKSEYLKEVERQIFLNKVEKQFDEEIHKSESMD